MDIDEDKIDDARANVVCRRLQDPDFHRTVQDTNPLPTAFTPPRPECQRHTLSPQLNRRSDSAVNVYSSIEVGHPQLPKRLAVPSRSLFDAKKCESRVAQWAIAPGSAETGR